MKRIIALCLALLPVRHAGAVNPMDVSLGTALRPPSTPLVTMDPYFSIWSSTDALNASRTMHWTGKPSPLLSYVRVDGILYRVLGLEEDGPDAAGNGPGKRIPSRVEAVAAEQTGLSVLPMRTVASFTCGPVDLDLVFTAPLFLDDLSLLSRPVGYVTWQCRSSDGAGHDVQVYFAASPMQAVHLPAQAIMAEAGSADGIDFVRAGTQEQDILGRKGDDVRIDWGYVYVGTPDGKGKVAVSDYYRSLERFAKKGALLPGRSSYTRESADRQLLSLSYANDLGKVGPGTKADYVMIAYDDIYSIQFFGTNLRPYWNRTGDRTLCGQMALAAAEYDALTAACADFDARLISDATRTGGREYAELCALAYRQAIAAHKLVESPEAGLLFLSKECFSNGSIGTTDVTYPSEPLFLYYNPDLAKGLLNPIFYYSESGRWTKPFAAHDVGTYPLANGQTYPGDMPVEESGNMLILTAAIAQLEGNADYASMHWETLTTWAGYLLEHGMDPENQLCTDDFAGRFAHNANLSIKAILGIASFARLAGMLGQEDVAARYLAEARKMASEWKEMAFDGDHYRLTFDKPGTWSQKYNLVWDKLLGTSLFDPAIARTEVAYYLTRQNAYGLPLDNRKTYTKTDWILWTATLSESHSDFERFVRPVWKFMDETEDRVPMSDRYFTDSRKHLGFRARSVVGGYFIKLLADKMAAPTS